ncbi:MAG: beta-lactamase family protein, partial [Acidobacteriota bacterium]|nr:beta-lactamase family protein [Acidobacteriota bacterium]
MNRRRPHAVGWPLALLCALAGATASLSAQGLPKATPEEVGLSSARLERVGQVFQSYADEGRLAGAVGMVIRHGKVAYVDAWGMRDVAARDPLEADDIFRIFS